MKREFGKIKINKKTHTIVSLDAINMYPSITFEMVKKAVYYFGSKLPAIEKENIEKCLEMIDFGMGNTLLTFRDKYWQYGTLNAVKDKRLTIGGYESAWLADLVAAYILENTTDMFKDSEFYGIYRDDGLVIFKGKLTKEDLIKWLQNFQAKSESICNCDNLQFTAELWGEENTEIKSKRVKIHNKNYFPYLDMAMKWNKEGNLILESTRKKIKC